MWGLAVIWGEVTIVVLSQTREMQRTGESRPARKPSLIYSQLTFNREHMKTCAWSLGEIEVTCLGTTEQGCGHQCCLRLPCPGPMTAVGTLEDRKTCPTH